MEETRKENGADLNNDNNNNGHVTAATADQSIPHPNLTSSLPNSYRLYIEDAPPIRLTLLLGFQHFLAMYMSTLSVPFVLTPALRTGGDPLAFGQIMSTLVVTAGLGTLLQTTLGIRLPMIQGGSFSYLIPTLVILETTQWPDDDDDYVAAPDEARPAWHGRLCAIQGAVIMASLFEILLGLTGAIGKLLRFLGPLTVVPVVSLIGLALFKSSVPALAQHWGVSLSTVALIVLFSQHLRDVSVPMPRCRRGGGASDSSSSYPLFRLFPIVLAMGIMWTICALLTVSGVLDADDATSNATNGTTNATFTALNATAGPATALHPLHTGRKWSSVTNSPWIYFPYPCQWGAPTVAPAHVLGLVSAVFAATFESIGDYYACARIAGAPPPPTHAVNRGVFVEGLIALLMGLMGSGNGTTSYSTNTAILILTKVGSRIVIQAAGVCMIVFGVLAKFSALFSSAPDPVLGGVLFFMFPAIMSVALTNLEHVPLRSSRNVFILAFSLFVGLAIPHYFSTPGAAVAATGVAVVDNVFNILLRTSMFVGGVTAFALDNSIPGTAEERGLAAWLEGRGRERAEEEEGKKGDKVPEVNVAMEMESVDEGAGEERKADAVIATTTTTRTTTMTATTKADDDENKTVVTIKTYDLPLVTEFLVKWKKISRFCPISPTYRG